MGLVLNSLTADLLVLLLIILTGFYFYVTQYTYTYWERRGVKYIKPTFLLGNFKPIFLQKLSIGELMQKFYNSTSDPYIGGFAALKPVLVIRDPDIARKILVKDFQHFHDRPVDIDDTYDPLSGNLVFLGGRKWANMRSKLTPTFTSGKLKAMFPTLIACGDPLKRFMEKAAKAEETVEIREVLAQYTTNVIRFLLACR